MAMTSQISSTFIIRCTSDAAEARTVVNPGRRFRIVNILVFNSGGTGNLTVSIITDAPPVVIRAAAATLNGAWQHSVLIQANCEIGATDNLTLTTAGAPGWAAGSEILIECVAVGGGQALTVT